MSAEIKSGASTAAKTAIEIIKPPPQTRTSATEVKTPTQFAKEIVALQKAQAARARLNVLV